MEAQAHPIQARARLQGLVHANPGVTITELAQLVGLSHSTTSYHLRILLGEGRLDGRRDGRALRFYASGHYNDLALRLRPLLQRERVVAILRLVQQQPDVNPFQIAQALQVSVPTVMWHLAKLREFGAIEMEKRHGQYAILLQPRVRELL